MVQPKGGDLYLPAAGFALKEDSMESRAARTQVSKMCLGECQVTAQTEDHLMAPVFPMIL